MGFEGICGILGLEKSEKGSSSADPSGCGAGREKPGKSSSKRRKFEEIVDFPGYFHENPAEV